MNSPQPKVLAIDDHRDNLITLQAVLSDALPGYTLLTALDGATGIEIARVEDPDAILLDIVMPEMDGFEVCRRLKAHPRMKDIPVVFLTALGTDRESRVRALDLGAEAFLSKPWHDEELVAQLRVMIKLKAANRMQRLVKEQLEELVADRTRELEKELAERQRVEVALRRSNQSWDSTFNQKMEAIGSLAGGIAHDFNNMLYVIMTFTDLAIDSANQGDPIRSQLGEVKKASERAATLIRQLLAFSRKQILQPVPLDLNRVTTELQKMLHRILGEDIAFVPVLAPELALTLADPSQIEQVLMNLAVNARDAMPTGGKLTIETANVVLDDTFMMSGSTVKPGPYVMLAVTDTGCGMDATTVDRIFEPFFTTKERGKGTGLGLSTVYGIVRQSGGEILVQSQLGQGTTFRIYLPRSEGAVQDAPAVRPAPTRMTGDETILIVEDEAAVRDLAKQVLVRAGYTVLAAANGGEALSLCERYAGKIHLALTDVVMPEMGGRIFAEQLARQRPEIKILYMSGYTDDAIDHHGTLDPGTHLITKPFSLTDLRRKVRELLDGN